MPLPSRDRGLPDVSLLKVEHLDKKFGRHYALQDVTFELAAGEVHALVGENGAGKSTLIKTITGLYAPDGGTILWKGKPVVISDPAAARRLGVNVVHQDRHLIPGFTGYENLYLGLDYPNAGFGFGVDWKRMKERARSLAQQLGVALDLNKPAAAMSPPEKAMLEILRAMMLDCRLLILDEPTAALTDREAEKLFALIDRLKLQGTAVLYVSHRLDEIFRIADRITVFRNGKRVRTERTADTNKDELIRWMSGGAEPATSAMSATNASSAEPTAPASASVEAPGHSARSRTQGPALLEVEGLTTADGRVANASLRVYGGEIVGVFGLAGSGRTEMLEAIYGLRRIAAGRIRLGGEDVRRPTPRRSLDRGVVLVPEERKRDALVLSMSIRENMTLPVIRQFGRALSLNVRKERQTVARWIEALKVKATGGEQAVGQLSGGNQQKVVFAKALLSEPRLFLCDEPTQAVDVMTREEIHRLLREQADGGRGVVFVSSDLQEVLELADRIYVLREGAVAAELANDGVAAEDVLAVCFHQNRKGDTHHG